MRPSTLAEACRRVEEGARREIALGDFLQAFYTQTSIEARGAMLADEPALSADARWNALVGGIAEYLFKRWAPNHPPFWPGDRSRYLREPWFPHAGDDPGLREYLTFVSPPEFKSRNIMTDEQPLRRAVTPPVVPIA